jgi:hypothetical protein
MLPGNGLPVSGSRMTVVVSEKSPRRIAALSTLACVTVSRVSKVPSYEPKKND